MKTIIRWYLPWFALFALIYLLCGCEAEGVPPGVEMPDAAAGVEAPAVPFPGPRAGLDAGSMPDVERTPDAVPVVPKPDAGVEVEARPPSDAVPAITCDKFGIVPVGVVYNITLPTTAYCFKLCPEARDPVDPMSYGWTCQGFTDADRAIAVNGTQVFCSGRASAGSGSALPATVDGAWTFTVSAGGAGFIAWSGTLRACP
jgi:hypothetical protein